MAPVLQCPDCGERHPVASVAGVAAFPCRGCGRSLKVPAQFRPAAATAAAGDGTAGATAVAAPRLPGRVAPPAPADEPRGPRRASLPGGKAPLPVAPAGRGIRFLAWILALPLGFALTFAGAYWLGFLTLGQVEDAFLEVGWSRFGPIARLVPVAALAVAALVHFGVFGYERWRAQRRLKRVTRATSRADSLRATAR